MASCEQHTVCVTIVLFNFMTATSSLVNYVVLLAVEMAPTAVHEHINIGEARAQTAERQYCPLHHTAYLAPLFFLLTC